MHQPFHRTFQYFMILSVYSFHAKMQPKIFAVSVKKRKQDTEKSIFFHRVLFFYVVFLNFFSANRKRLSNY